MLNKKDFVIKLYADRKIENCTENFEFTILSKFWKTKYDNLK